MYVIVRNHCAMNMRCYTHCLTRKNGILEILTHNKRYKKEKKTKMYMQFSFLFRIVENGMCDANEYVTAANLQQCKK